MVKHSIDFLKVKRKYGNVPSSRTKDLRTTAADLCKNAASSPVLPQTGPSCFLR